MVEKSFLFFVYMKTLTYLYVMMKSKVEEKIFNKLRSELSEEYSIIYEPHQLIGSKYKLKVDYIINYNSVPLLYVEYSGMNFFRKYLKLVDILKNNKFCVVIFDDENLDEEIDDIIMQIQRNQDLCILNRKSYFKTLKRIEVFNEEIQSLK